MQFKSDRKRQCEVAIRLVREIRLYGNIQCPGNPPGAGLALGNGGLARGREARVAQGRRRPRLHRAEGHGRQPALREGGGRLGRRHAFLRRRVRPRGRAPQLLGRRLHPPGRHLRAREAIEGGLAQSCCFFMILILTRIHRSTTHGKGNNTAKRQEVAEVHDRQHHNPSAITTLRLTAPSLERTICTSVGRNAYLSIISSIPSPDSKS